MPHIAGLTLVLAAWEVGVGVSLLLGGRSTRVAVVAILGFFAFLLVLGYGWPAHPSTAEPLWPSARAQSRGGGHSVDPGSRPSGAAPHCLG